MANIQPVSVDPNNPQNLTSSHRNEIGWSIQTPPVSLGRLDPPRNWHTPEKLASMKDPATGHTILDSCGVPIPDYPFLPRYLSSNLEWFRVEAYFREHKDMSYYHIWQRQPLGTPIPTRKERNNMNNMRLRKARRPFNTRCWTKKSLYPPRILVELVEGLSQTQLLLNTTWIVTPHGIRQPGTERLLPLNMFLDGNRVHTLSAEVRAALAENHRLQALANAHNVSHWSKLPKHLLPDEWFGRARTRRSQGAQNANHPNNHSPENDDANGRREIDVNMESNDSGMPGNVEDGRAGHGHREANYSREEKMQSHGEEENSEEDTEREEERYHGNEARNEDEEGINPDDSGAERNRHLSGSQAVVGVATLDDMNGGDIFQNAASHNMSGMKGASGAVYNGYPGVCSRKS